MMTCGEATMRLLARYGITTVFGIPGVHTLDMCRGLSGGNNAGVIKHIQARNEQGAGFMAEGWARATGEPGVAVVISGPGVTNATTALGQCYADSLPMLLISAEPQSESIGKGWGVLHEITEQKKVTEPLTAFSATAHRPEDVPELMAKAFSIFASERPRPCHISLPTDIQAMPVTDEWNPVRLPSRPSCDPEQLDEAAALLKAAKNPLIMVGGGAVNAAKHILNITERLGAIITASTAGKGIVPDDHPLSLSAGAVRAEARRIMQEADVVLAVGTELSETDRFGESLVLPGAIIRIDIDASKISDLYPATIGIIADAESATAHLSQALEDHRQTIAESNKKRVAELKQDVRATLNPFERQHTLVLDLMRKAASDDTIFSGDACQIVYTGAFSMIARQPRTWFYPVGYCALGNALPNAIGAKLAKPDTPVVVLVGDGGFMFTMPELVTAAELGLPLPVVIWENDGLKQIRDNMDEASIAHVGVDGINPDFELLAKACHCHTARPDSAEDFTATFREALNSDRPTVIIIRENAPWLTGAESPAPS